MASLQPEAADAANRWWRNPAAWLRQKQLSRGFWTFFAAAFFFDFGFAVYFFLFNLYLLDLRFSDRDIGIIGGAFTLGTVAGTLPAGKLARRFGVHRLLIVCFIAAPVLGALRSVVMWRAPQIALGFLAGLAMCLWGVCFLPALARLTTEENRASGFSVIFSVSIGTSALGGAICGYLPQWLNYAGIAMSPAQVKRLILLVSCGIAAMGLAVLPRLRLPGIPDKATEQNCEKREWWRLHPFLLRFLPVMALWAAVLAAFNPFANVYLSRVQHIPMLHIGLIFSMAQILQFALVLLTPVLFRALGLIDGIVATQILTAAALGCLAATQNPHLAMAMYLGFSAMQWMSSPGLYNLLMSSVPDEERSTASSMTLFWNAVLAAAATAGAGILFTRFGYPRVLAGIAVLAVVVAMLFRLLVGSSGRMRAVSGFQALREKEGM
ncbi:MAG TPA: MFS transporter [Acidobacteriaceae bacterium]|nr:MFS transporter [Acidobacteriaceae bacterium]